MKNTPALDIPGDVTLTSLGHPLAAETFGVLRSSSELRDDPSALRQRLEEDGYVYLPKFFPLELILAARRAIFSRLAADGELDPGADPMEGRVASVQAAAFTLDAAPTFKSADGTVRNPDKVGAFRPELAAASAEVKRVVFGPELETFYHQLFGAESRHLDFIWARLMGPGHGTPVHCDQVYMGRGSADLLTCWIPYVDIPLRVGGLILLEQSHRQREKLASYLAKDVDAYCSNRPAEVQRVVEEGGWSFPGWLSKRPDRMPATYGGRWLTVPHWSPGDFITFRMDMVHASLDNQSDRIRFSTDTRYQPATHPADPRWIGATPPGHSQAGKLGRVC
jgi:hypothetical protein